MTGTARKLPGKGGVEATSSGVNYLLRGFALLKHKRILPFVIAPLMINAVLFYLGLSYLHEWFTGWITPFIDRMPAWLAFIGWLLNALFYLAALLLVAFGFTFVANLIGSPFYGLMAEQVEIIQCGSNNGADGAAFSGLALLRSAPGAIVRELTKLLYYLLHALPIVLLGLVSLILPPLATLMPFIWFSFGAKMLALEYIDYAYDNNQLAFSTLRADIKANRQSHLGFGAITTLASMIPVLNILTVPAAVCGGTLFYLETARQRPARHDRDSGTTSSG